MTHAEEIVQAVTRLVRQEGKSIFTREEIRQQIGVSRDEWMSGYTAIFQGMRADQPGGAPKVGAKFIGVFRQVKYGKHTLTDYGWQLLPTSSLGPPSRRTQFTYAGDVHTGVTLHFTNKPRVSAEFFQAILNRFRGETIPGGFSMTNPTPGGLGEWVQDNSARLNLVHLTPRHASFIAAILVNEGLSTSSLKGNKVYLHF